MDTHTHTHTYHPITCCWIHILKIPPLDYMFNMFLTYIPIFWYSCCWGQIFQTIWLHFINNPHYINIIMNSGRIYFKTQKSPYLQKWCRSPWSKTHGDIISSRPIVRAHGTTSHFWLMIQAHEYHRGNFRNRGLEVQEVCLVKLQWSKVDKGKYVAWHVFPNFLNSDGLVCNK